MSRRDKSGASDYAAQRKMIGDQLSFAGAEAYKLLRTNIEFSLPDEEGCRIIGVTSGMSGEGKSTTSINLAYSLAETGRRVLLMEADMRLPTLHDRIGVSAAPGLSNLLVGRCNGAEVLQKSGIQSNLYVISGGDIPPNPSELLGSDHMSVTIKVMSQSFDFIILDLPPVNVVADALVVSKFLSGMVVVVRQDYATRKSLSDLMRQLQFQDIRVLGFVLTRVSEHGSYYKKNYYKSYSGSYASGKSGR